MDLSIIIVNWRSADYLGKCLESIRRGTRGIQHEVIVVDNASYDGCDRLIRDNFPHVVFVQSERNLGFSGGNNLGYQHSSGDVLLFLNPDTEIIGDALVRMAHYLRSTPRAGAVGARLLNSDGSLQTSCVSSFPTLWNQVLDFDILRRATPTWSLWGMGAMFCNGSQPLRVQVISGACLMVKREAFTRAGLFSEEYFMYSDDLDLCYRIHRLGFDIYYMNDCSVVHHGAKSSAQRGRGFSDIQQRQSLAHFFTATRGQAYAHAYRAAMACISILRLALLLFLMPLGGRGVEGRSVPTALRKWSMILRWAVGAAPQSISTRKA